MAGSGSFPQRLTLAPAGYSRRPWQWLRLLGAGAYVATVVLLMAAEAAAHDRSVWPFLGCSVLGGLVIGRRWALVLPLLAVGVHGALAGHSTGLRDAVEAWGLFGMVLGIGAHRAYRATGSWRRVGRRRRPIFHGRR